MKFHEIINKNVINNLISEETLEFILCRFIAQSEGPVKIQSVINYFDQINNKLLNKNFFESTLYRKFKVDGAQIILNANQKSHLQFINNIIYDSNQRHNATDLVKELSLAITENFINKESFLQKIVLYKKEISKINMLQNNFEAKLYNFLNNYENYYNQLDKSINTISEKYENENLTNILYFEYNSNLINSLGIAKIGELKKFNVDAVMCLLFDEIETLISNLNVYSDGLKHEVLIALDQIKTKIKPKDLEILLKRHAWNDEDNATLEDIGKAMHLTRERIRQIEKKSIEKLKILYFQNETKFNSLIYILTKENDYFFAKKEDLIGILGDRKSSILFKILLNSFSNIYSYSKIYSCFYLIRKGNESDIVFYFVKNIGNLINQQDYLNKDELSKQIIRELYNQKSWGWIKKGSSLKDFIIEVMSKEFKNGYHISDDAHYAKLKRCISEKFGHEITKGFPSKRSIFGFIERSNYILYDRGTYIDATHSPKLNVDLKTRLLSFLENSNSVTYYLTLYHEFEIDLKNNQISNHYHLKGLLDTLLIGKYDCHKDYIITNPDQVTPLETIRDMLRTQNGIFQISTIINRFPGIKSYVYWNVIYEEENTNGLIRINRHDFIYANNLTIENSTITSLKTFLDKYLNENDSIVSSKLLFGKLYYEAPSLLKKIPFISNHFGLFSLFKYLFESDFFFRRPKIAKTKDALEDPLKTYLLTLNEFDKQTVDSFLSKRGLSPIYSYLDLVDEMSDDFIQISTDKMIKRNHFILSERELRIIENIILSLIKTYGKLEVSLIKNFSALPKLNITWTQYLLVGIIRTFLFDKFEIFNDKATYDKAKFTLVKK